MSPVSGPPILEFNSFYALEAKDASGTRRLLPASSGHIQAYCSESRESLLHHLLATRIFPQGPDTNPMVLEIECFLIDLLGRQRNYG